VDGLGSQAATLEAKVQLTQTAWIDRNGVVEICCRDLLDLGSEHSLAVPWPQDRVRACRSATARSRRQPDQLNAWDLGQQVARLAPDGLAVAQVTGILTGDTKALARTVLQSRDFSKPL